MCEEKPAQQQTVASLIRYLNTHCLLVQQLKLNQLIVPFSRAVSFSRSLFLVSLLCPLARFEPAESMITQRTHLRASFGLKERRNGTVCNVYNVCRLTQRWTAERWTCERHLFWYFSSLALFFLSSSPSILCRSPPPTTTTTHTFLTVF